MTATRDVPARRALVTGAASGIGAAFAERLARDGYDLVMVDRRADAVEGLAARLQADYGTTVDVSVADLAHAPDLRAVEENIANDAALELLVNNAGFATLLPFEQLDANTIEAMIRVHVVALVRLTRAALPGMLARNSGGIINVASILAFAAAPSSESITYCATKAFVNTFTHGVHHAVRGTGVRVQALCPGWTRTAILEHAGRGWDIPESATMAPQVVVDASLTGLRLGEVVCAPSLDDPNLIARINELENSVAVRALSSGTPARRYAAADKSPI